MNLNFIKNNQEFIIGLVLTLSLLWPLFWAPYFSHHDDVQVIRLYEMDKCFKDGQIPCRWVPDLGGLYGYPLFNYYAPLPYYFGEMIYFISGSLIFSVKIMFAISFLGAFILMYLVASKYWGKLGGSLAAIFYSFAPYHALDFYVRGAMGEMWALMFIPAIFWALTRLMEKINILNLLLLTITLSGLALSHNLSLMIFLPIIFIWIIFLYCKNKDLKFLIFACCSLLLAFLLSSFYLLPMLVEKNLVHVESTTVGYFGYTEHFKGLKELFIRRDWGWGSSIREVPGGEKEMVSFQIGWVHLMGWFLTISFIKFFWSRSKWVSLVIGLSSLIITLSIFMIHPKSEIIWRSLTFLKYLQFPWRFLLVVIFFTSFITGSIFLLKLKLKQKYLLWGVLTLLIVGSNFLYFRPEKFIYTSDQELLSGENWDRQIKRSIFDYLPIFAKEPPAELASSRYQILTGDVQILDFREGTDWITFKAKAKTHTIIRLSQYYFPEWKIFVNGQQTQIDYQSNNLGLMTLILGEGDYTIEARLDNTPIRNIANLTSLIGFIFVVTLLLFQFKSIRKWILYYRKRID